MLITALGKCVRTIQVPLRFFIEVRMARKALDLTGQRFGKLTVIERAKSNKDGYPRWLCKCDCGNTNIVYGMHLKSGASQSCGCLTKEKFNERITKHGLSKVPIYPIWKDMKHRCYNPNDKRFANYGARGIKVCDEWLHNFQAFYNWAMTNGYKEGLSIDRIDTNGDYKPSNCRWATNKEQANNTTKNHLITYNGKTQTMAQWAEETKIKYTTLRARINTYHWSIERALTTK